MTILRIDEFRTLAFGSITAAFVPVGNALTHNWRAFRIINKTDGDMIFSVDGTTNNLFVPANSFVLYDISTNSSPSGPTATLVFSLGTQFFVKQSTAPTLGAVYIEGIYERGQ